MSRILAALLILAASPAAAGDLLVSIGNIPSAAGEVLVAVCPEALFPDGPCPYSGRVAARAGRVEVRLRGIPPGRWALAAFQDQDGDGVLGRDWLGRPREPIGFGNDAAITRFGPPGFEAAAIEIPAAGEVLTALSLRTR